MTNNKKAPAIGRLVLVRHGQSDWNQKNLFTGWTDVDLTAQGREEARQAGRTLAAAGLRFDIAFTSVLTRAIRTLWLVLDEMQLQWLPVENSWRLNERHYGSLQGLDKAQTTAKHGEAQVKIWRRSYDIPPPPLDESDERHPRHDPRYAGLPSTVLPGTESLKTTLARVQPYWEDRIAPEAPARPQRARRRARQQLARAREDARRHRRRRDHGAQHSDGRAALVRARCGAETDARRVSRRPGGDRSSGGSRRRIKPKRKK